MGATWDALTLIVTGQKYRREATEVSAFLKKSAVGI